jgi:conjugative relaxase-like TrwC/TraI family protein
MMHLRLAAFPVSRRAGVLSVAKLTLGQETYYEQQVVRGMDDYYAGRGESPGIWAGRGASELELVGVVEDGDLGTLLRGLNPASEKPLRRPVRQRTIAVRTLDVETGRWVEEWKAHRPVSGYDLVFSCPKSVSLLHALTDDERVRREIAEAHEASWQAALGYLEREACVVRRGKGGKRREHGQGFVAATFRHRTSRAQEPHLHTHVVVANMTRAEDGTWLALDGESILKTYRLAAGYLYEAQLRHELAQRLGLTWTDPMKGMAELERVPEEAIRAFSSRRQSLVEHMDAHGTEGFAAARVAALATRERREQVDLPRLREEWKARAAEFGLGRRELQRLGRERPRLDVPAIDRDCLAERLFGPEGLTAKQTTFALPELVQAVAGSLREGADVDRVLEEAEALLRLPGVERLEQDGAPGRPARFTTRELLALERDALELALAGSDVDAPRPDKTILARRIMESGRGLTGDQGMLVHEASRRRGRVLCIAGAAGSGKTTALRVVADAYREGDVPLLGAAPSGRAADELLASTGIASSTLHRLLLDAHREGGLPRGCVLLVDEAGMAETRVLAPVLELVERAEGRAILVGDPHQLPSVGAGGLFPALCERLGAIDLADNRRQRDLSERRALTLLREGEPDAYLAHAARRGRLHLEQDPTEAKQRLLEDWWQVAQHDLAGSVMLAYRRSDVRELNEAARTVLARAGRLGPDALDAGGREFRVGDRVLCRRNERTLGLRNGTRGTIVELESSQLTLRTDAGSVRSLPLPYACEHLDHAYALTGHAAQGATVERAFVLLPDEGALREWGYVACSRARAETHVYLAERDPLEHETPLHEPNPTTPSERAVSALERSSAEPLALDQRPHQPDTIINFVTQQQQQLEQHHERTAEQLAAAQRELEGLHWWKRGRRADLETEIALHDTVLERADAKAEQLRQLAERRLQKLARDREGDELTIPLRPEPARRSPEIKLEREPPGLGLEL